MPSPLSQTQLVDWLRLIRSENVGPATFRKLLNKFGSASAALDALPYLSSRGGKSSTLKAPSKSEIEDEIGALYKFGAKIITVADTEFPELLKHISSSPPILTILGNENAFSEKSIAIVGARNASSAGMRLTKIISSDLSDAGYKIISGLARGIDTSAHKASLEGGTIAVLAGGIDNIYPSENINLAKEIIGNGGALISEMPLGTTPRAQDFPRRNRIVSGISKGVIVIEAAKRSGSLITARLALEQNREVFAAPSSPLDPRSAGPNSLIQQGASLITNAQDVLDGLAHSSNHNNMLFEEAEILDYSDLENSNDFANDNPDSSEREKLLSALSVTPISVDEIIQQTKIPTLLIQTMLLELDIAGRIEWASGQLVYLKE